MRRGESVSTSRRCELSPTSSCRWLADALVCVDVALTVGAGVRHILEVVDQAGNQAAAEVTPGKDSTGSLACLGDVRERALLVVFPPHSPHKEAEEAEQRVHEPHVVGDAGDDGLLTVRTHGVHRRCLEHLPLQHRHRGGGPVASHVDKLTRSRTGTHLSRHRMRKVTRRRGVHPTCG